MRSTNLRTFATLALALDHPLYRRNRRKEHAFFWRFAETKKAHQADKPASQPTNHPSSRTLMTVLRLCLATPCSWNVCRVVSRRCPCPYSLDRSSRSVYSSGGHTPAGILSRSMNEYAWGTVIVTGNGSR